MNEIEIKKDELLAKLRENRDTHQDTYDKAVVEYRRIIIARTEEQLERARKGFDLDWFSLSRLPVPENHTRDYDIAIEMLELEIRETVMLEAHDFQRYWRDEWEWRHAFAASTQSYASGSMG